MTTSSKKMDDVYLSGKSEASEYILKDEFFEAGIIRCLKKYTKE